MNQLQNYSPHRANGGAHSPSPHKISGFVRYARLTVSTVLATLLLSSCGGGGGSSPAPIPVAPSTPPAPPVQGLLDDQQLGTSFDANQALVDSDAVTWFSQNAKIVRSLTVDNDFSDLAFLTDSLDNKRIVMLGESSHGVEEFSQAKIRLIKYLHEEQDFNVLAFESGLFECENAQRVIENGTARGAMSSCLFGVWQTQTVLELFEYVKQTQSTSRPLRITGFDVQFSSFTASGRADYTGDLVAKVSDSYADEVRALEQTFYQLTNDAGTATDANDPAVNSLSNQLTSLTASYGVLADYLQANAATIAADGEYTQRDVLIAAQYARTSPYYAQQLSQRFQFESGGRARDRGMAENVIALANSLYPNEKIIGWAHNAHLRHQGTGFLPDGNMGTLVHNELESELYTVGFYMYRGEHAFNDGSIQQVNPPLDNSLEAIFFSRRLSWLFLDIENANTGQTGADWLDRATPTWAWGSYQRQLSLAAEYDGLFIVDTVTPPDFL